LAVRAYLVWSLTSAGTKEYGQFQGCYLPRVFLNACKTIIPCLSEAVMLSPCVKYALDFKLEKENCVPYFALIQMPIKRLNRKSVPQKFAVHLLLTLSFRGKEVYIY
jgi:hypothetical protein